MTAYTFAIRRLQGVVGTGDGRPRRHARVAVLMRYTLRLLTAQQFQRAAALVCACEMLRRERIDAGDAPWGRTPFRIGLWVGSEGDPELLRRGETAGRASSRGDGRRRSAACCSWLCCPWCGARLIGRRGRAHRRPRAAGCCCTAATRKGTAPSAPRHSPGEGLPVVTVDEEIYRLTPALVIATVDKFAQLPWRAATATLFGLVDERCARHGWKHPDFESFCKPAVIQRTRQLPATRPEPAMRLRPPDLIIQDELHLISRRARLDGRPVRDGDRPAL